MKSFTKIISAVALTAAVCLTANYASAQQSIATWDTAMNGPGGPTVANGAGAPSFTNNTGAANVIVTPLTKGSGVGAITTTAVFGGNSWTNAGLADSEANSIANGLYITYTVQAAPGYTISFSTNVSFTHNSATGPYLGELQYSTNGITYADLAPMTYTNGNIAASPVLTLNLSTNSFLQNVASTTTNYFRIVNWGGNGASGTWYFYNPTIPAGSLLGTTNEFAIFGSVTPIPLGQNLATWDTAINGPGGPIVTNGIGSPSFTNNTVAANVIVTPLTKGPGVGAITTTNVFGGNSWTNAGLADSEANSIANGLYLTYSVQSVPGYTISFFTNEAFIHYSATGPSQGELQYSTDGINYSDILPITYGTAGVSTAVVMTNNLTSFQFLQNVPSTVTNYFRIVNWGASVATGTWYLYNPTVPAGTLLGTTNEFVVYGGLTSLNGVVAPTNLVVSPTNITANAGQNVSYTATYFGSTATNFWYQIAGTTTNLIPWATSSTLTLTNVLGGTPTNYFLILTNLAGSVTSAVVTLNVQNDPNIIIEPSSVGGLLDGTVQFSVTAVGTSPNYQWYFTDTSGNIIAGVGSLGDGSVISGGNTSTLTFANLQPTDLTNFVVVVTNNYGAVTSTVASVLGNVNNPGNLYQTAGMLGFWDFDGGQFTNTTVNPNCTIDPLPLIGNGTASPVGSTLLAGSSPFAGSTDPGDVAGVFTPYGFPQLSPNFSWGVDNFPASGSNKLNGVQFNVSTVGAKNVTVTYDARVSATASDYDRLQYTTNNGTTWFDYPASSTFATLASSYYSFAYNLTGYPGVANNPNFGVRIVTEAQSTATYGISSNTNYVGTGNTYGTGGTFTFDLVAVQGDAITNGNTPPLLGSFVNTNMVDTNSLTLNFTVTPGTTPADSLVYNAVALPQVNQTEPQQSTINPTFAFGGSGNNRTLTVSFGAGYIPDANDAGPILITATDANGDSSASWFVLSASSINQPPTNSLTSLTTTNTLVNTAVSIPFIVGSARDGYTNLTFTATSDNNTVIPAGNIVVTGDTNTANRILTITPASEQVGNALITVTVSDNDPVEPRFTTANISVTVKPNASVVAIDYFNYDSSGSLDSIAAGYWQHLSGVNGQLKAGSGVATVDTADNTENLVAPLVGAPYATNSGAVLYSSMTVNMNGSSMPTANGSYFACYQNGYTVAQNGSGATTYVEGLLVAATNGAAPGYYRLGVANVNGDNALDAQIFPQDLSPGVNYVVVTSLVLSNGFTTLWINPTNQSAQHVINTTPAATPTNLYSISDIELRESGANAGSVSVGDLLVGLTFKSVIYPPVANPDNYTVSANSVNNVLNALTNDVSGGSLTIISAVATTGTASVDGTGTNVLYTPNAGFTGTDTIAYTIEDNLGNMSSSTITVTVPASVVPTVPPAITGFNFSFVNGNLVITGTNAQTTGVYYLLESTNLATPLSQWVPVATNVVSTNGANGAFTFTGTNVLTPSGNGFYILSSTNN